ncbi:glycosyltransferase [uncultured Cocleimonas sp.]|uniref:glycosyltransferase n=1 Tax=uncultured Cocleimonas sp. TaxID=1051587 RepID=UPI002627C1CA|nr:glycosyltransferase [uncultured Cocleimonas sp.]
MPDYSSHKPENQLDKSDNEILKDFSIIIPSWNQETALNELLVKLEDTGAEIIVSSEGSRAKSLNAGAKKATRKILWFVHADSQITKENIQSLISSLQKFPDALHYFKLQFAEGGLSAINAGGANLRSSWFDLPYGDQAFCIDKKQFYLIGNYPEDTPYGEDLLFVRLAKKCQVKLVEVPSFLISSARKYNSQGWVKTSITHWYIMFKLLLKKL